MTYAPDNRGLYQTGRVIQKRLSDHGNPLRHIVSKNEAGNWVTTCSEGGERRAVRDYKGYRETITCPRCRAEIVKTAGKTADDDNEEEVA